MKTKQLTQRLPNNLFIIYPDHPFIALAKPKWPHRLASPLLETVSIWLELYSNLLLLSLLPVACLIPAWCHFCTVAPYCWAMNPFSKPRRHASHPPSFSPPPSSFLSALLPVALQISGGRQCQTFQLFKQVSGWCRVPAGLALPLWCPTLLVCANPLNPLSPRELQGPNCTDAQLRGAGFTCNCIALVPQFCISSFVFRKETGFQAWWKNKRLCQKGMKIH